MCYLGIFANKREFDVAQSFLYFSATLIISYDVPTILWLNRTHLQSKVYLSYYSPRVMSGVRGSDGSRDQLVTLRGDFSRLLPMIAAISRIRCYRLCAIMPLRRSRGTAEIVLPLPLLRMIPRCRVRPLR